MEKLAPGLLERLAQLFVFTHLSHPLLYGQITDEQKFARRNLLGSHAKPSPEEGRREIHVGTRISHRLQIALKPCHKSVRAPSSKHNGIRPKCHREADAANGRLMCRQHFPRGEKKITALQRLCHGLAAGVCVFKFASLFQAPLHTNLVSLCSYTLDLQRSGVVFTSPAE